MELNKLKSLLGISPEDTSKDVVLGFILDNTQEFILNYCHLKELPNGLLNTAYRMAIDLYKNETFGSEDIAMGSISSISEGDVSVSYRSAAAEFEQHLLKNYTKVLNKYRRVSFI